MTREIFIDLKVKHSARLLKIAMHFSISTGHPMESIWNCSTNPTMWPKPIPYGRTENKRQTHWSISSELANIMRRLVRLRTTVYWFHGYSGRSWLKSNVGMTFQIIKCRTLFHVFFADTQTSKRFTRRFSNRCTISVQRIWLFGIKSNL